MGSARRLGQGLTFGGRVPVAVGAIIAVTVVASLVGVVGERNGLPLLRLGLLEPRAWSGAGEVWRLVTWASSRPTRSACSSAVSCSSGSGATSARSWGERRFLLAYLGIAAAAGLVGIRGGAPVAALPRRALERLLARGGRARGGVGAALPLPPDPALLRLAGLGPGAALVHGREGRSSTRSSPDCRPSSPTSSRRAPWRCSPVRAGPGSGCGGCGFRDSASAGRSRSSTPIGTPTAAAQLRR